MADDKSKKKIEVVWFVAGSSGRARNGCWLARLVDDHAINDAGETPGVAIRELMVSLHTLGMSGERGDYEIRIYDKHEKIV